MKKLLLLLLCVPLMFSCGEKEEAEEEQTKEGICVKGDCENGEGTFVFTNGEKYIGEWKDGKRNGKGCQLFGNETYSFENGISKDFAPNTSLRKDILSNENSFAYGNWYVGEWKDGLKHGEGTMTYSNGDKYIGEWKEGKRNGKGISYQKYNKWLKDLSEPSNPLFDAVKVEYVGVWKNDKYHGVGELRYTCLGEDVEVGLTYLFRSFFYLGDWEERDGQLSKWIPVKVDNSIPIPEKEITITIMEQKLRCPRILHFKNFEGQWEDGKMNGQGMKTTISLTTISQIKFNRETEEGFFSDGLKVN